MLAVKKIEQEILLLHKKSIQHCEIGFMLQILQTGTRK